ncbi:hypothetical protein LTR85_007914 [Meristemomyces frigidus]|nr:hypothetical protein LTR85_007914 [Meristemomyces frigidus]
MIQATPMHLQCVPQQAQNTNNQPHAAQRRPQVQQQVQRLVEHANPNDEPVIARRGQPAYSPGIGLPYDDDALVEDEDELINHHEKTKEAAAQPTHAPKKLAKQPLRGRFITGLFRPNGPAHLVHGTEEALAKLSFASKLDNLAVVQQPLSPAPGVSDVVEAILSSAEHLKVKGYFPTSFMPISLDQPVSESERTLKFQNDGMPPFKALDISRLLHMLHVAGVWHQTQTGSPIIYALGVVTHRVAGMATSLRAQLFTTSDSKIDDDSDVSLQSETIWLYRRIEHSTVDGYTEVWRGFGTRTHCEDEDAILSPLHPVTNGLLTEEGDGFLMPASSKPVCYSATLPHHYRH